MRAITLAAVVLVACGQGVAVVPNETGIRPTFAAPPGGDTRASDSGVRAGHHWVRTEADAWSFQWDDDLNPTVRTFTGDNGRGYLRMDLPRGAQRATLRAVHVAYINPGKARWSIVNDNNGKPGDRVLHTQDFDIRPHQVGLVKKPPKWTSHKFDVGDVPATFWLMFTPRAGGASVAGRSGDSHKRVLRYWRPTSREPSPLRRIAYVRADVTKVRSK